MKQLTKQTYTADKGVNKDYKIKFLGLLSLVVALAELAATYIFATQDNHTLYALAFVLGVDAAQRFARAFVK